MSQKRCRKHGFFYIKKIHYESAQILPYWPKELKFVEIKKYLQEQLLLLKKKLGLVNLYMTYIVYTLDI